MIMLAVKTRRVVISRNIYPCPRCGGLAKRHGHGRRSLREIGVDSPAVVEVTYSKHYCEECRKHFSISMEHIAPAFSRFTHRVRWAAIEMVAAKTMTLEKATLRMWQKHFVRVPLTTLHDWVRDTVVG
jgi:transposase